MSHLETLQRSSDLKLFLDRETKVKETVGREHPRQDQKPVTLLLHLEALVPEPYSNSQFPAIYFLLLGDFEAPLGLCKLIFLFSYFRFYVYQYLLKISIVLPLDSYYASFNFSFNFSLFRPLELYFLSDMTGRAAL